MNTSFSIFNGLERLIDISLTRKALLSVSSGHWIPAVDIYETPDTIVVFMEIAGVPKNDISVSFKEGFLTVHGQRKDLCCDNLVALHCMEIDTGRFHRKVRIRIPIDSENIEAVCRNGILKVTLQKEGTHDI